MFDQFTLDIIDTFDGIQAFARREGDKDFGPLRKATEVLRQTATDMEQRALRATDATARDQYRVLAQGFAAAVDICEHVH
ncbi:hypothetical protein LMG19083_03652 [Ralstonia psammae]|jgi:hypothetical protein|uniref:Type III secretion protein HrpX n=2 Tax=Ralstonia TaxID=48736 RepID=A0AAD2AXD9_9RALS|nr:MULTISPECIES: type III secretion protein HrpX [Ralstonia]CAJ0692809.1 hypothetical protein LMG18091_01675 [Ralstonia wenshanensis]CAJ0801912.1 hypothetical protein LMG19083_03652 [Ralstonia sp. LMG 19083]